MRIPYSCAAIAAMFITVPAAAETLRVEGYVPAAYNGSAEMQTLAVERFSGPDGHRLSFVMEDRLRDITLRGEPWFTVLTSARAADADGVLQGNIAPTFSESTYQETRNICWTTDAQGRCIEYRDVELDCLRVTMNFAPDLRLVSQFGELLWSDRWGRSQQLSYCPEYDDVPNFEPYIEPWLTQIADQARFALAPSYSRRDIRIMENRSGLDRETREVFRDAVRLTDTDEEAACDVFETLYLDNPEQPSLIFNSGLCAEQRGDWQLAEQRYRQALGNDRSDDEGQDGLRRLNTWRAGLAMIEAREAWESPDVVREK